MTNRTLPLGLVIIAAGLLVMLGKLGVIQALLYWLWPLLMIAAGAACYLLVWNRTFPSPMLVAGAVLSALGIVFMACIWFGWVWMRALWPAIPLSMAIGLFQLSAADRLPPLRAFSLVASTVSLLLLVITMLIYMNGFVVALLLIVIGVVIVSRRQNFR